jgi:hypothetical protein
MLRPKTANLPIRLQVLIDRLADQDRQLAPSIVPTLDDMIWQPVPPYRAQRNWRCWVDFGFDPSPSGLPMTPRRGSIGHAQLARPHRTPSYLDRGARAEAHS